MEPQRHQRPGHHPDHRRANDPGAEVGETQPPTGPPPRLGLPFQLVEREEFGGVASQNRRDQPDDRRHRQERELAAHIPQVARVPGHRQEPCAREQVARGGAPVPPPRQAGPHRHRRRPDHGGLEPDEDGVRQRPHRDHQERRSPPHAHGFRQSHHHPGQDLQVQARDRQQVGRPGPGEGVVDLGADRFATPEQERRRQGQGVGVETGRQLPQAPGANGPQPPGPGPVLAGWVVPDSRRPVHGQPEPDALPPEHRSRVELAGIERPLDARDLARRLDRAAGPEVGPIARHPGLGATRDTSPAAGSMVVVDRREGQHGPGRSPVIGPVDPGTKGDLVEDHPPDPADSALARPPLFRLHGPRQVIARQVGPAMMVPRPTDRQPGQGHRQRPEPHPVSHPPTRPGNPPRQSHRPQRQDRPGPRAAGLQDPVDDDPQPHRARERRQRRDPTPSALLVVLLHRPQAPSKPDQNTQSPTPPRRV